MYNVLYYKFIVALLNSLYDFQSLIHKACNANFKANNNKNRAKENTIMTYY